MEYLSGKRCGTRMERPVLTREVDVDSQNIANRPRRILIAASRNIIAIMQQRIARLSEYDDLAQMAVIWRGHARRGGGLYICRDAGGAHIINQRRDFRRRCDAGI